MLNESFKLTFKAKQLKLSSNSICFRNVSKREYIKNKSEVIKIQSILEKFSQELAVHKSRHPKLDQFNALTKMVSPARDILSRKKLMVTENFLYLLQRHESVISVLTNFPPKIEPTSLG